MQLFGFNIGNGALTDVRWLGDQNANDFGHLTPLDLSVTPVPEPASMVLRLTGSCLLVVTRQHRRA